MKAKEMIPQARRAYYEEKLKKNENDFESHNGLAFLFETEFAKYGLARHHYERAIAIKEEFPEAHNNLAMLLETHFKEYEVARLHYEKAIAVTY